MSSTHVQTTLDYIRAFKQYLDYDVSYLHVTYGAHVATDFDLSGYDIIFHNYCSRFCFDGYVSQTYREAVKRFTGLKILAVQDEYDHTDKLKAAISDLGFHIVLTCVPQDSLSYVYPPEDFPNVEFITVFTGYVPDDFAQTAKPSVPLRERPTIVAYRGRDIGPRYGRLGFEKFEIGRRMKMICDAAGVSNDIAMTEESRIYGTAWFDFIGNCRAMLGSESGSNVFDFDGSVDTAYQSMKKKLGRSPTYNEFGPVIAKRDSEISMGQISPRVFECAVMRTPMILFRGRYSDAIEAVTHYIPLELDFSNAGDVLQQLQDIPALEKMAERANDHLVRSRKFGYRAFVLRLKGHIESHLSGRNFANRAQTQQRVKVIPALPGDRRLAALAEWPVSEPKGSKDFGKTQLRLSSPVRTREVKAIDDYYWRIMGTWQKKISDFDHLNDWLSSQVCRGGRNTASRPKQELKSDFESRFSSYALRRQEYHSKRSALATILSGAIAGGRLDVVQNAEDAVAEHDQSWAEVGSKLYSDLHNCYVKFRAALKAEAAEMVKTESTLIRANYEARRALIFMKTPKYELLKIAINYVPGARKAATFLLNRLPRRT